MNVTRYFPHPNYNSKTFDFDIALLRLSNAVKYSRNIQPVMLPKEDSVLTVGTECTVSGWGLQSYNDLEEPPLQLMMTKIQITDFKHCKSQYENAFQSLTDRMLCASVPDGSRDACLGDSVNIYKFFDLICNFQSINPF